MTVNEVQKILKKLDRPPSAANFVRFIDDSVLKTTKYIVSFAVGMPLFNYQDAYKQMRDRIQFGISIETALRGIEGRGSPLGRMHNNSLICAFFNWDRVRRYSASNIVEFETAYYRVSREILVPVSPLSVIRENGKFLSLFVCGWNNLTLNLLQRRFLRTIYEDAFLSLTDYSTSPAEFLFFPQDKTLTDLQNLPFEIPKKMIRKHEVWDRNDYEVLSNSDVNELLHIFIQSREQARAILLDMAASGRFDKEKEESSIIPASRQQELF
jgi:hypothetical protein